MAYQSLGVGTNANDGSGDTLRSGGAKVNDNFVEIYTKIGNGSSLCTGLSASASVISLVAPNISGVVAGTQTSATITTLATTTVNGTTLNAGTMAVAAGSITDSSGAISFGNEDLTTTGTLTSGNLTCGTITSTDASIVFEGATPNAHETTLTVTDPTADRTITFGDETGTVLTTGATNVLTGNMMKSSSTLLIVDSAGSTLKTIIGAGSAS
jgi:hypothetical protein|tara:strand:- start:199 stop:834 length:636 start_codon:yes stop_codon:yes gene_type:complete